MDPKDEIKRKVNIVELVGEYLEIKPSGSGSFKALCPFHGEKTPSFHISEDKQIWHCFGCGEGGDCFSFIMQMEGMDFSEALRTLGKKVGVEVKRFSTQQSNERTRLIEMHELSRAFYAKILCESPVAAQARAYVASRGITQELIELFGLGYAPPAWDTLTTFLNKRGFSVKEGLQAGLLLEKRSGSGCIDRFRGRLMIPLRDHQGETVGFTARLIGAQEGPKYLNSPETPIYHKGELLFGLDLAKSAVRQNNAVIVVEGNLDVVASHKAGVAHVVASSGTALTQAHLERLARYTDTIIFCFDQDAAGLTAAKKGARTARTLGLNVRALSIDPNLGKDPDDIVQKNPQAWVTAVSSHVPFLEYLIDRAKHGRDLGNIDDKKAVAADILPELAVVTDPVELDHWTRVLADLLATDPAALKRAMQPTGTEPKGSALYPKEAAFPKTTDKTKDTSPKEDRLFGLLLGMILHSPEYAGMIFAELDDQITKNASLRQLYKEILAEYDRTQQDSKAHVSLFAQIRRTASNPDLVDRLAILAEQALAQSAQAQVPEHVRAWLDALGTHAKQQSRRDLARTIRQAERDGDQARLEALMEEFKNM